jgi:3-oxoacyl-[acyl-carrier protein] reductase
MNALVTGGSRGIGRAIVLRLAQAGHGCAFTYAQNAAAAEETLAQARTLAPGSAVRAYRLDVKQADEVERTVEAALGDFGDLGAVVNNAAVVRNQAAVLMSNAEWDEVIATNLTGPFYVVRALLMHFLSNRRGRIVNLSSLASDGCSGQVNYAASKAGLAGLTRTLAKEYGGKGVTANLVTVGYVPTDLTRDHLAESLHEFWLKHCPLKRVGSPEEIAHLVNFLISDEAAFINGEDIRVSGGLTYAP